MVFSLGKYEVTHECTRFERRKQEGLYIKEDRLYIIIMYHKDYEHRKTEQLT